VDLDGNRLRIRAGAVEAVLALLDAGLKPTESLPS